MIQLLKILSITKMRDQFNTLLNVEGNPNGRP